MAWPTKKIGEASASLNSKYKMQNSKLQFDERQAVILLDGFINHFRANGLQNIPPDCNNLGQQELNILYREIYNCVKNKSPILALAGEGMFFEEFVKFLWITHKFHEQQKTGKLDNWDEAMEFKQIKIEEIENKKINYKKDVRSVLEKLLEPRDLESLELLREIVRNTSVHSKRIYLIKLLQKYNVLPKTMPVVRAKVSDKGIASPEKINVELTHPLFLAVAFKVLAEQIAPAVLIFIYELFSKYHKSFSPLPDNKLGFSGD